MLLLDWHLRKSNSAITSKDAKPIEEKEGPLSLASALSCFDDNVSKKTWMIAGMPDAKLL